MATIRLELNLSDQQMAMIEWIGNNDAHSGMRFGLEEGNYDSFERKQLNNRTVRVLNALIENLRSIQVDQRELEKYLDDEIGFENSCPYAMRFGNLYFELAESQIYVANGEDAIPSYPYTVGYPLRNCLDKLGEHSISEHPGTVVSNGIVVEGGINNDDENYPIHDFMFDETAETNKSFWYIVKLLSLVI